jgi:hypothetical protein
LCEGLSHAADVTGGLAVVGRKEWLDIQEAWRREASIRETARITVHDLKRPPGWFRKVRRSRERRA